MAKISLEGFKDPARRPRYVIWTVVGVLCAALFMIAALGVTSTYWFCANGCHKVQDDTITAFDSSVHSEVSCMSCHMPVGAGPVTFLLHKAEALGELYLTVTNTFELPLNGGSELALDGEVMNSGQCTQCHSDNRRVTPSKGIIIDHEAHAENDVHCTVCHNRVAHPENFELTLPDNAKHDDFMTMTACFRCHSQEEGGLAPGACEVCHPPDFELKPDNHFEAGFYQLGGDSSGHAQLALRALGATSSAEASGTDSAESTGTESAAEQAAEQDAAEQQTAEESSGEGRESEVPPLDDVFYCGTCHANRFCESCHGLPMPHPPDFVKGHGELGKTKPEVCSNCHAVGDAARTASTQFCNSCHHPQGDPTLPWVSQHFKVVQQSGASPCFECHDPTYCAKCHVRGIAP
jgi:hypothetical protein